MRSSGIGGQAVIEGVMMRNHGKYAVAVRTPDGEISVKTERCKGVDDRPVVLRLPIVRGVVAFVDSLVLGMKTLTYSSSLFEEIPLEQEDKKKESIENFFIILLAVLLAVGVFMVLPFWLSQLCAKKIASTTVLTVVEGVIRIGLFVLYVLAISCMKDIKRTFMYHGAEHKVINCIERGKTLTVANARKSSRFHRRCGTSFLFVVMLISVILFVFVNVPNIWMRMVYRILLIPVVAGISYEFILWAGNSDNIIVKVLSIPGLALQGLTTREPDDDMLEVAIASVNAVFDWKNYQERLRAQMRAAKARKKRQEQGGDPSKKKLTREEEREALRKREEEYRRRKEAREQGEESSEEDIEEQES